jgi:hypothetical protein
MSRACLKVRPTLWPRFCARMSRLSVIVQQGDFCPTGVPVPGWQCTYMQSLILVYYTRRCALHSIARLHIVPHAYMILL